MTKKVVTGFFRVAFLTGNTQVAINTDGSHPIDHPPVTFKTYNSNNNTVYSKQRWIHLKQDNFNVL